MNSIKKYFFGLTILSAGFLSTSCQRDPNDPGTEYAPQMYHSIPYEPLSQTADFKHPYNEYGMNMRKPVAGTIKRSSTFSPGAPSTRWSDESIGDVMIYNLDPNDIERSAKELKNPYPASKEVLAEGAVLYNRYCAMCHGENGDGQGKVAAQYKGVPSYNAGRVATLNEGHIFHTITYGRGRMWPHGSQVSPQDRWKIVHYVQSLQKRQ
jgi:mono/diheme cytochrome c family protein